MVVYYTIVLGIFILITAGCNKYARYKVLTFFFTGVPHPDEKPAVELMGDKKSTYRRPMPKKGSAHIHGPYASKQCFLCHETTPSIRISDAKGRPESKKPKRFYTGLPGRLRSPLKKLCIECHPSKSQESAFNSNLWIHGPVADGMCIVCHSPHASQNPFFLFQGSSNQLCIGCHTEGFITPITEHLEGEECTVCHNAHIGKTRFLLKKDFDEIF